ncbi:hypothetical protein B0H14DRAFT_2598820 [Mycena olivaceomarginata]|nr:hypothetical protein B0H14DRAFT_2598820 [Mycena olivaceomarginata]
MFNKVALFFYTLVASSVLADLKSIATGIQEWTATAMEAVGNLQGEKLRGLWLRLAIATSFDFRTWSAVQRWIQVGDSFGHSSVSSIFWNFDDCPGDPIFGFRITSRHGPSRSTDSMCLKVLKDGDAGSWQKHTVGRDLLLKYGERLPQMPHISHGRPDQFVPYPTMPHQPTATELHIQIITSGLAAAVTLLDELNDAFGPPFIQPISKTILLLIDVTQNAKRNKNECARLMENIHQTLYAIINLHLKSETVGSLAPVMLNNLANFMGTLHKIYTFVEAQQDGNKLKHLFHHNEMNNLLRDWIMQWRSLGCS